MISLHIFYQPHPAQRVGFLPAAGSQEEVTWVTLEESQAQTDIDWKVLTFTPPPEQDNSTYSGLDFEAILLKPMNIEEGARPPLIVTPHGGPHSVFVVDWLLSPAVLCHMGFAVLLVNYRRSIGYGQASIFSLPGKLNDFQYAVESLINSGGFNEQKVAVSGGSHGRFLTCHLIGQFPSFYKACVARNLVVNLDSMIGSTDIPDW
ncbi:hypothetical protein GJAV_G00186540 [Gymnothorax javanicus]|nr:hypothetical protein GJAV_G00186540 [Gymnothorax javanicus]